MGNRNHEHLRAVEIQLVDRTSNCPIGCREGGYPETDVSSSHGSLATSDWRFDEPERGDFGSRFGRAAEAGAAIGALAQPNHSLSDERQGISACFQAGVALAADFHRLGGARWCRREA